MKHLIFFFLFCLAHCTFCQDGTFDNSFGTNGIEQFSINGKSTRGRSITQLPNDNILISGVTMTHKWGATMDNSFFVRKLLPNGDLNTAFGNNGTVYFLGTQTGRLALLSTKVQPDGKILLLDSRSDNFQLIRLNPDGSLDSSFGSDGMVGIGDYNEIALQSNGKIILSGYYYDGYKTVFSLSRYSPDGTLDISFGNNGVIRTDISNYRFDICRSVFTQPDDKILAVGATYDHAANQHAVIARFNENGSLDTSFGNNGVAITPIGPSPGYAVFQELDMQPNGKIVVCGKHSYQGGTGGFYGSKPIIVKFNPNGSLDQTFGNGGKVILNTIFNANDSFTEIVLQADNKIILGGRASYPFPYVQTYFYLTRFSENGNLDTTFGNNGKVLTQFNNYHISLPRDVALQQNGKILTIGFADNNTTDKSVVCRFNNSKLNILNFDKQVISVYPNPSQGDLYIDGVGRSSTVKIFSLNGQLIMNKTLDSHGKKVKLNLNHLSKGFYILSINQNSSQVTKKLIVN